MRFDSRSRSLGSILTDVEFQQKPQGIDQRHGSIRRSLDTVFEIKVIFQHCVACHPNLVV